MDFSGLAALLGVPAVITAAVLPLVLEQTHIRRMAKMIDLRAKMTESSAARDDIDWLIADSASELALRRQAPKVNRLWTAGLVLGMVYGLGFFVAGTIFAVRNTPLPAPQLSEFWGTFNWLYIVGSFLLVFCVSFLRFHVRRRRTWIERQKRQRALDEQSPDHLTS